ncbi:unnamed protein product [Schistocephalus solidus]|uniref:Secreted protein n=1 Tax=Schistocephalus solidus TaxID=70667 RepID=A0A183TIV4_SCHSO|nr:unnamed protein product [Schistocephalus solidus]
MWLLWAQLPAPTVALVPGSLRRAEGSQPRNESRLGRMQPPPALTPAGQTAPEAGSHQGCGLLVPTPVLGASSATYSTSNASGLPPGETKLQVLPSSPLLHIYHVLAPFVKSSVFVLPVLSPMSPS